MDVPFPSLKSSCGRSPITQILAVALCSFIRRGFHPTLEMCGSLSFQFVFIEHGASFMKTPVSILLHVSEH